MKRIIYGLIKNPLTIWVNWYFKKTYLEIVNRRKSLVIGYMSRVQDCKFGQFNAIFDNVHLTGVELGDFTYIAGNTNIADAVFGKFCSIGPNVRCGLGKHPTSGFVSTHPAFFSTKRPAQITFAEEDSFKEQEKIIVGNDVWIGANAIILDGVNIGTGVIVGAGAVVTKDVPPYSVVAGVPAKVIKYRFPPEEISFLLRVEWWNKDIGWLKTHSRQFSDVEKFKHILE